MDAEQDRIRLWLWDGVSEYEGRVVRADGRTLGVMLRQGPAVRAAQRTEGAAKASPTRFQRRLSSRRCLIHFRRIGEGLLLEAEVNVAQRCSEPDWDLRVQLQVAGNDPEHERVLRAVGEFFTETAVHRQAG